MTGGYNVQSVLSMLGHARKEHGLLVFLHMDSKIIANIRVFDCRCKKKALRIKRFSACGAKNKRNYELQRTLHIPRFWNGCAKNRKHCVFELVMTQKAMGYAVLEYNYATMGVSIHETMAHDYCTTLRAWDGLYIMLCGKWFWRVIAGVFSFSAANMP